MFERTNEVIGNSAEQIVLNALTNGITAAKPKNVLQDSLSFDGEQLRIGSTNYELTSYDEIIVLGGGNGAGKIASALYETLGDVIDGGVIITDDPDPAGPIDMVEGTHPIPSVKNIEGTQLILDRARICDKNSLVLVAVTGGGSALMSAPVKGVSLNNLQTITNELLESGAPIDKINTVRKHISGLKGGQLARELHPADTVGLVFSDVSSGDPSVVASGPLSPDPTTYEDALSVLSIDDVEAPESIVNHLQSGANGEIPDTPDITDPSFETVDVHILADGFTAISAAADVCESKGFEPIILSSSIRGEAREAAKTHVAVAEECLRTGNPVEPPVAILSGGETTVTIKGDGVGGPNQEFVLSASYELPEGTVLGAVDTDGIDGPTEAAGGIVTDETVSEPDAARTALADNAAYLYLHDKNALLVSGKTGTNVNDLRILLVR